MRHLHLIRDSSGEVVEGVCAGCHWRFRLTEGEVWGNAKDFLRRKFNEHKCGQKDSSQVAGRGKSKKELSRPNTTS